MAIGDEPRTGRLEIRRQKRPSLPAEEPRDDDDASAGDDAPGVAVQGDGSDAGASVVAEVPPEIAHVAAGLAARTCSHGRSMASCGACLVTLLVPTSRAMAQALAGLYAAWPDICDECLHGAAPPRPATHQTTAGEDGEPVPLCDEHAPTHPGAAEMPHADVLRAAAALLPGS